MAALLERADARGRPAVLLARDAGLRRIEIARARGGHVERHPRDGRQNGWIRVPRGKGDRGRSVPVMTARLRDALLARGAAADEPLIANVRSDEGVRKVFDQARAVAGVGCSLLQLRHGFATWLRDCRHPSAHRRAWLGHGDEATLDGYTHDSPPPDPDAAVRSKTSEERQIKGGKVTRLRPRKS